MSRTLLCDNAVLVLEKWPTMLLWNCYIYCDLRLPVQAKKLWTSAGRNARLYPNVFISLSQNASLQDYYLPPFYSSPLPPLLLFH